jgi:Ca2+-binding EF-hand superfamily protein
VTDFKQVDIDKDGSIDHREFKDGCKAGLVRKAS